MRFVVYGAGAIGGVVGGRLAEAGHEVVLIARGEHHDAIRVDGLRLVVPDGEVVTVAVHGTTIEVADRGPGIDAEDRDRVFDRFYRATSARTRPGSGLGLSIVSQIATLHGGTVTLDARAGGGTVARLSLPA